MGPIPSLENASPSMPLYRLRPALVVVLLGILLAAPLGIVASRRNVLGGVTAAIGIFIALRFLSTIVLKAGEGLDLPPATAAWSINVVFAIAGVALLMHRSRNRRATR